MVSFLSLFSSKQPNAANTVLYCYVCAAYNHNSISTTDHFYYNHYSTKHLIVDKFTKRAIVNVSVELIGMCALSAAVCLGE